MAKLAELRRQAKSMGIAKSAILGASTPSALQAVIDSHNGTSTKPMKKSAVKKAVAQAQAQEQEAPRRGRPRKKAATSDTAQKTTVKRGRPKSASSKSVPAKSTRGRTQAKRPTTAHDDDLKRNLLNGVDYGIEHEDWNPRPGSIPDQIVKALKRFRGNRKKVYEFLLPNINQIVKPTNRNGRKLTKDEQRDMLKYRISRTAWEFAMRTEQHDKAEGRVKYGEGGTGFGIYEPKRKTTAAKAIPRPQKAKPKARPARKTTTRKTTTRKTTAPKTTVRKTAPKTTTRKTTPRKTTGTRRPRKATAKR
jgi:hypothetical protein